MRIELGCRDFTLDNGLRLLVHEDHTSPIAAVNVWYHVGSRNEMPGRTGFAHLFEHLMFEGSANVPPGAFDRLLEEAGAINNGSTTADRTNYWETLPSTAVELALFLEADRMAGLIDVLTQERFDAQRDVVMNERRESYENRPYGLAYERLLSDMYAPQHPYHWPVIGFMADLEAASLADAVSFGRTWYVPDNASLAVAGDIDTDRIVDLAHRHFGSIPRGPARDAAGEHGHAMRAGTRRIIEDIVPLPRLYITWHTPRAFADGDAAMDALGHLLSAGKASRLYRSLVSAEHALDVSAHQQSGQLSSSFDVCVTARPGVGLSAIESIVRSEIAALAETGPLPVELQRVRNATSMAFVDDLQTVGGFGGRADRLNLYEHHLGNPVFAKEDLARCLRLEAADLREAAATWLHGASPTVLSVVPQGRSDLAATPS